MESLYIDQIILLLSRQQLRRTKVGCLLAGIAIILAFYIFRRQNKINILLFQINDITQKINTALNTKMDGITPKAKNELLLQLLDEQRQMYIKLNKLK